MNKTLQDITQVVSQSAYSDLGNCWHRQFESQVKLTPNAIALTFKEQQLTYQELNCRANQLANYLINLAQTPEIIGIYLERSLLTVAAILGISKAGSAYLPLNPNDVPERNNFIIKDASISLILTQKNIAEDLPLKNNSLVCLDRDWTSINSQDTANLNVPTASQDLAYVMYTPGFTNNPEGVMVEHHSVVNLLQALEQDIYQQYPQSLRISLNASISSDASIKQIIQLLKGHNLYIMPEEERHDLSLMLEFIETNQLNILDCTSAYLELLINTGLLTENHSLKAILIRGGELETQTWNLLKDIQTIDFYSVYGSTECAVSVATSQITKKQTKPTIGRSLLHTQIYILDEDLHAVPIGMAGELYIGGAQIARGYINNPELTAERFIANPFDVSGSSRLYKTGDKGRYLSKGNIEYLGQIDAVL